MQTTKRRKRKLSLSAKMTLVLLIVILLPSMLLTGVLANTALRNLELQTETLLGYKMEKSTDSLEKRINSIYDILYQMATDQKLQKCYLSFRKESDVALAKSNMRERFISYVQMNEYLVSATYIGVHDEFYTYESFHALQGDSVWTDDSFRNEVLRQAQEHSTAQFISMTEDGRAPIRYFVAFSLYDIVLKQSTGILVLGIEAGFFDGLETNEPRDKMLASIIEVVDADGRILYASDTALCGMDYVEWDREQGYTESDYQISQDAVAGSPWTLRLIVKRGMMIRDFLFLVLALLAVSLLVTVASSYGVSRYFTKNLKFLANGLHLFGEGEIGIQLPATIEDEFYPVVVQFNEMSTNTKRLIEQLDEQQRMTVEAVNKQRQAELRALEMQINPHFLYNTLDAINWMAIENGQYKISEMLADLASILRYSVSNIDMNVPVRAEVEWLERYLFLQKQRFPDRFEYTIDAPEETRELLIRKMLLQPLVENAIVHGLAGVSHGGRLDIRFRVRNGQLALSVADNGCGMEDGGERLNCGELPERDRPHIGIANVRNRLASYYGAQASIHFVSEPGKGTAVVLKIPAEREEGQNAEGSCS